MAIPSPTRERILDAFEHLLIEQGERGATLDGVAADAGVSKGGLLYHFASKDALAEGLIIRLGELAAVDVETIRSAPAGAVDYLIRTSASTGAPLDRAFAAVARLAQGAHQRANDALAAIRHEWVVVIEEAVGEHALAQAILLISDGLYYESALVDSGQPAVYDTSAAGLDALLGVIGRMTPKAPG